MKLPLKNIVTIEDVHTFLLHLYLDEGVDFRPSYYDSFADATNESGIRAYTARQAAARDLLMEQANEVCVGAAIDICRYADALLDEAATAKKEMRQREEELRGITPVFEMEPEPPPATAPDSTRWPDGVMKLKVRKIAIIETVVEIDDNADFSDHRAMRDSIEDKINSQRNLESSSLEYWDDRGQKWVEVWSY